MRRFAFVFTFWLLALQPSHAIAANDKLLDISFEQLTHAKIRIATGTDKLMAQAPAAASIITAAELEALGARDIDEALELIPGLHVSHGSFVYASRYFIRGIVSTYNPHTLVLVNGVPQSSLFTGDRGERIAGMNGLPVSLVDRIEIIRGPGSALYGADAFAGVINIITKSPSTTIGGRLNLSSGSFDTHTASLYQGGTVGSARYLLSLAYGQSEGDNPIIDADYQTAVDALFGTHASYAPGSVNLGWRNFDSRGDVEWQDMHLRFSYRRSESETGHGINEALDPTTRFPHHHGTVDWSWHKPELWRNWEVASQLSYLYSDFRNPTYMRQLPPGTFGGLFPEGLLQKPELSEENVRLNLTTIYHGFLFHRLQLGAGFHWGDIFRTTDSVNYELTPGNPVPQPLPLRDVSDTRLTFLPENQRTNYYAFIQDEWNLAPTLELTSGLRYDGYSDFGSSVNPRLALVWNTTPQLTSKLLYGSAFRAPAFFELYARNNPVALGNPVLKPETLHSLELALAWKPAPTFTWDFNLYAFQIRDFIDFINDPGQATFTARNTGRIDGQGLETEIRQQYSEHLQLLANYSYQRTEDNATGASLGLTPSSKAGLRMIWTLPPRWQVTPQVVWVSATKRQGDDSRSAMSGYTTADLTVRNLWSSRVNFSLAARNIFDADRRDASRGPEAGQTMAAIPNDLPQAGRSISLETSIRW